MHRFCEGGGGSKSGGARRRECFAPAIAPSGRPSLARRHHHASSIHLRLLLSRIGRPNAYRELPLEYEFDAHFLKRSLKILERALKWQRRSAFELRDCSRLTSERSANCCCEMFSQPRAARAWAAVIGGEETKAFHTTLLTTRTNN